MSILTDVDIKKARGRDIVIEPFSPSALTPVGYDFAVGDYVFSLEHGLLSPDDDGVYALPPKSTIQVLTRESLWVSGRLAGTFHSKVSLVSMGISHISTTLDPGWYGPLLITIRNNRDIAIMLARDSTFVTLIFYKVSTPTKTKPFKPEFRKDILLQQLASQEQAYIDKVAELLDDTAALAQFRQQVESANQQMHQRIISSARQKGLAEVARDVATAAVVLGVLSLASLQMYWGAVSPHFGGIDYDSKVFVGQMTVILALISIGLNVRRR